MAQVILLDFAQFGEGALVASWNKKRIVPKSLAAPGFEKNAAFANSLKQLNLQLDFIGITDR